MIGKVKLSTEILNILSEDGYRPELENNENAASISEEIIVKIEGLYYRIIFYKDTPNYLYLTCHILELESERRLEMLERVNRLNGNVRYAQAIIYDNNIYSTCDMYFDEEVNVKDVFYRNINAVIHVSNEFWSLEQEKVNQN